MTVILDVPCVYTFVGASRKQPVERQRYALCRIPVELEVLRDLPTPFISVVDADDPEATPVDYHMIGGNLLRPVFYGGVPASFAEIENATALVSPPTPFIHWFHDHPSSIFRTAQRPHHRSHFTVVDDVEDYRIVNSDLEQRIAETRETWSRCLAHDGAVIAPARAPTWCVRVNGASPSISVNFFRRASMLPEIHFAIEDESFARDFALRIADVEDIYLWPSVCSYPSSFAGFDTASLEMARAFAFWFCKRHAGRHLAAIPPEAVKILAALRTMYEGQGSYSQAEELLKEIEVSEWRGLSVLLRDWIRLLRVRRVMLTEYDDLAAIDIL